MVEINSTSRLSSLNTKVLLVQTDTTVGLLSQDDIKLQSIKERDSNKPFIKVYKNFQILKKHNIRIPNAKKALVRRARKTTFIVKNIAFRVSGDRLHSSVLRDSLWNYSSSANERGKNFSRNFCEQKTDIIVEDKQGLYEDVSSSLYKINNKKSKRLR